jgi:glycosyltransferase involved in cell wall biosynthesis
MNIALVVLTGGRVSGGFAKYLDRMLPLLRARPEIEAVTVWVPPQMAGRDSRTWPSSDPFRGFTQLRHAIEADAPDVVFIPTARRLRVGGIPVVTMVRNMEPLEVPFEGNGPAEMLRNIGRAWEARSSSRNSDRVIAVSKHVRDFLTGRWGLPADRIGVVYHGVDPAGGMEGAPRQLRALGGAPFLFTAGSIRAARGLEDVLHAMPGLPAEYRLVIAGNVDSRRYERKIQLLARQLGVESRVIWAGHLNREEMAWCFRQARAFVMTSRAEACPNIVLEAMAEGAISVSTDHPPMPEFFGDSALYYRERDAQSLTAVLISAFEASDHVREQWRETARLRARAFTWEATARGTVLELQKAIEQCASFT